MIVLINDIIGRFGPRKAGSEAEKNAQLYIGSLCREFTDDVQHLEFNEHLRARFGKLKYYVIIYLVALALYWVSPTAGLILSFTNAFFVVFDLMMYRDILTTFPGGRETSWNMEATLEPQGNATSTIIVSSHMDSTVEYTWWYKLGELGVRLTVTAGVLMVFLPLFYLTHLISPAPYHIHIWWGFVVLSPILIVFWSMHGKDAVPGACDNLSGTAIAFAVFKHFKSPTQKGKSILKNTRIRFVSFGSEELGLCGSRAYVKLRRTQLQNENAFLVNIDTIRLVNEVAVVERELMNGTKYPAVLVDGVKKAFSEQSIPLKSATLPIGGTDGVSFARAGLPAVSIIGISSKNYDFTYHTRDDVAEHIEVQSLENTKNGISHFIIKWDESNAGKR